jgi:hypothetical protein
MISRELTGTPTSEVNVHGEMLTKALIADTSGQAPLGRYIGSYANIEMSWSLAKILSGFCGMIVRS